MIQDSLKICNNHHHLYLYCPVLTFVHAGATPAHNDLIRAATFHLLAMVEVLPGALAGGPHLAALVVSLAAGHLVGGAVTVLVLT